MRRNQRRFSASGLDVENDTKRDEATMNIRKMMVLGMFGGGWKTVSPPVGWTWSLPFAIQQMGRSFRIDPAWDLKAYANVTVAKSYYVDSVLGSNANAGDSFGSGHALKDLYTAMTKADVDQIFILAGGSYGAGKTWSAPARSMNIIGVGGTVDVTSDCQTFVTGMTLVGNHYEGTVESPKVVNAIWDANTPDVFGDYVKLIKKTSSADVEATPGSWYQSGTTIYVRTLDSRAPDVNLKYYQSSYTCDIEHNSITVYCENIRFLGGARPCYIKSTSAVGGLKVYFKGCTFLYGNEASVNAVNVSGVDEVIFQNCVAGKALADCFNYHALNTIIPRVAEINCEGRAGGVGTSDQSSTAHEGMSIVRVGGKYHDVTGQVIADVDSTSKSWNLGCEFYNSGSGIGVYSGCAMWLDCCWSHDNANYDIQNTSGTTTYIRNFIGAKGVNDIAGTLSAY